MSSAYTTGNAETLRNRKKIRKPGLADGHLTAMVAPGSANREAGLGLAIYPDLRGASVFITGGGKGIGAALTDGYLAQGAQVAFCGRSDASAFVAEMQAKHGAAPLFLRCDVTDVEALQDALAEAGRAHGPLDVLVNNAADDLRMVSADVTPEQWEAMIAVNLRPYFFGCQAAYRQMKGRGGRIVNYSSTSYMLGMGGMIPYTSSNAAITAMTKGLAREWGPEKIRVNAIAPGWVLTQKQLDLWATPESLEAFRDRQSLKDFMAPEDMVDPTLFLSSDASKFVTGTCLIVDAGVVGMGT